MSDNEEQQLPGLTIGDIMMLKQIVELSSARGAFRASELSTVGEVYNRLTAWVEAHAPAQEPEEAPEEDTVKVGGTDA